MSCRALKRVRTPGSIKGAAATQKQPQPCITALPQWGGRWCLHPIKTVNGEMLGKPGKSCSTRLCTALILICIHILLAAQEAEQGRKAQGRVLNASGIDPSEEKLPQVWLEAFSSASFPVPASEEPGTWSSQLWSELVWQSSWLFPARLELSSQHTTHLCQGKSSTNKFSSAPDPRTHLSSDKATSQKATDYSSASSWTHKSLDSLFFLNMYPCTQLLWMHYLAWSCSKEKLKISVRAGTSGLPDVSPSMEVSPDVRSWLLCSVSCTLSHASSVLKSNS